MGEASSLLAVLPLPVAALPAGRMSAMSVAARKPAPKPAHAPTAEPRPYVPVVRVEECPLCSSGRIGLWRRGRDRSHRVTVQTFEYARCRDCDLIFLATRPPPEAIGQFYPEDYGPYKQAASAGDAERPTLLARCGRAAGRGIQVASAVAGRFVPSRFEDRYWSHYEPPEPGQELLDFGCGSDRFLNRARKLGWRTVGIDFHPTAVSTARASGHRAYLLTDRVWDELPDGSLSFVRLSHVAEHLYDPHEVFQRLHQKMRPGARLHVAVPNPASITSLVCRSRWWGLECPRHIMLYTPQRLRRLLADVGFSSFDTLHEPVTKDVVRSVAYLLHDWGWIDHAAIHRSIDNRPAAALLAAPMRLAALIGRGDRFHVFAQA
jgi:SAM-dependent methyltransferase